MALDIRSSVSAFVLPQSISSPAHHGTNTQLPRPFLDSSATDCADCRHHPGVDAALLVCRRSLPLRATTKGKTVARAAQVINKEGCPFVTLQAAVHTSHRPMYHTQLSNMSFDNVLDLVAEVLKCNVGPLIRKKSLN